MNDRLQKLADKAKSLPKAPGVYLMKDDKGRVIYVGKSASLRDRVGSYFQPSTKLEHKKAGLLDNVVDFETIQTDSEVEALLAENRLIKDIQPKYNARLLDDKTFPYLMVTTKDEFPGVYVTREPVQGAKLYGPFTSVYALKEAVTLLQKAFKFRTCHLEISESDDKRRFFRPCLLYPIKQCTAPCAAKVSKETYADDVKRLIKFLDGDKTKVMEGLERDMLEASKDMNFERAARLRDEIKALQGLGARAAKGDQEFWQPESFISNPKEGVAALQDALGLAEPPRILETIDIAHLQGEEMVGSKVCFIDGVPFKDAYRRYKINHGQGNNDFLSIQEVVSRRYKEAGANNELYPDVICIDGGLGPAARGDGRVQADGRAAADGDQPGQEGGAGLRPGPGRPGQAAAEQRGAEAAAVQPGRGPPLRPALPPHPASQGPAGRGREAGPPAARGQAAVGPEEGVHRRAQAARRPARTRTRRWPACRSSSRGPSPTRR